MKTGIGVLKTLAVVITAIVLVSNMTYGKKCEAENNVKEQIMEIACHYCHENFSADVSQSHVNCPHCGETNEFSG
ncbi:MAG: hypothetical protein K6F75_04500 [Butyrivibrio sp.]|nr:hypothetical protein [Butyrivibrio sp.]